MASESSPADPQLPPKPESVQSKYVLMPASQSPGMETQQRKGGIPEPAMIPSFPLLNDPTQSNMTHTRRKQRSIVSGLPEKVYDLSLIPQSSSSLIGGHAETEPPSFNSASSKLLQLLPLLPRKRQRRPRTGPTHEDEEGSEDGGGDDDDDDDSDDQDRAIRRRRPILRGDEASHLRRDERDEYERKRDERLAHYKVVDDFQLHTEEVLWI